MSEFTVNLPKLGESIVSATIVKWLKNEGDNVSLDEPLLEVATDKINSEIPSPVSGKVGKILALVNEEKNVGDPLVVIHTDAKIEPEKKEITTEEKPTSTENSAVLSPAVLGLMQQHNLSFEEIEKIPRASKSGRLSKKDIQNYLDSQETSEDRIIMSPMRKAIAENMVKSFYKAPHASLIHEIDVTAIVEFIAKEKANFLKTHGVKVTITSFIALAISKALKKFPLLNATLQDDTILLKKQVNLGIAVSVENGIMVPVIKDVVSKDLLSLSKNVAEIATKVRENSITNEEMQNGTITMTNFGMGGVMIGIPIIRHPEMAIVGVGALKKKPAVIDDKIAIRTLMHICLTFDHRVIDGMYGCAFLQELQNSLDEIPLVI